MLIRKVHGKFSMIHIKSCKKVCSQILYVSGKFHGIFPFYTNKSCKVGVRQTIYKILGFCRGKMENRRKFTWRMQVHGSFPLTSHTDDKKFIYGKYRKTQCALSISPEVLRNLFKRNEINTS